jgi:hypothetical protein
MIDTPPLLDLPDGLNPTTGTTGPGPDETRLPVARDWEITAWASHRHPGVVWRLQRDGTVVPYGGTNTQRIISTVQADQLVAEDTFYPVEVSALPPLIRELDRFRGVSEYLAGPADCLDGACEHPLTAGCPDVRRVLATAREAIQLDRVRRALSVLDTNTTDTASGMDEIPGDAGELGHLRSFADRVRQILVGDDDDDD